MIACGHGFADIQGARPAALDDFLNQRRDAMACSDLPADVRPGREQVVRPWRYLMYFVGISWRILGVSWRGMGPAFGFLFGASIALAYRLCRLAMSRLPALGVALGLSVSTLHLLNLPHLRDFAKEPFALALFLILGLLVTRPPTYRWIAGLAGAYGVVLGIAYGFRTDFLINIPLFLLVLALFIEGGPHRHLRVKLAGVAAFFAAFLIVGWPILSSVYSGGGCQWHVALLGLTASFDEPLHVAPAPYDFGQLYSDGYIAEEVDSYARRAALPSVGFAFCSHDYDTASGKYLTAIAGAFPADIVTRAYASILRIVELPRASAGRPLADWHASLYDARETLLDRNAGWSMDVVGAALLLALGANARLGLFLLFVVLFVGGYPAIQFQPRHYFHLEFIPWFALGFVVNAIVIGLWSLRHDARRHLGAALRGGLRAVLLGTASAAALIGALVVTRAYQERRTAALMNSYLGEAHVAVDLSDIGAVQHVTDGGSQLLSLELNLSACAASQTVSFRYLPGRFDLARTVVVRRPPGMTGTARVLAPAFAGLAGIDLAPPSRECVTRVSRLADVRPFPLLLNATLLPGWERRGLHQRLADWESSPTMQPFVALPPVSTWKMSTGARAHETLFGTTVVDADNQPEGYQITAPPVHVAAGATVMVRTDFSPARGHACLGVLNYNQSRWLVSPIQVQPRFTFGADASGGFILLVANCNPAGSREPGRFSISRASYSTDEVSPQ
jgi:hypothetical protein